MERKLGAVPGVLEGGDGYVAFSATTMRDLRILGYKRGDEVIIMSRAEFVELWQIKRSVKDAKRVRKA